MRERLLISVGLILFVAVATLPFWMAHNRTGQAVVPQLQMPVNARQCIAPTGFMRRAHMRVLLEWRDDVVRRNQHEFVGADGKVYQKSLTKTCLGCHSKTEFCDRCHSYAGVSTPYCWNCHNQPQTSVAWRSAP
jgi:hypothetical protein